MFLSFLSAQASPRRNAAFAGGCVSSTLGCSAMPCMCDNKADPNENDARVVRLSTDSCLRTRAKRLHYTTGAVGLRRPQRQVRCAACSRSSPSDSNQGHGGCLHSRTGNGCESCEGGDANLRIYSSDWTRWEVDWGRRTGSLSCVSSFRRGPPPLYTRSILVVWHRQPCFHDAVERQGRRFVLFLDNLWPIRPGRGPSPACPVCARHIHGAEIK